MRILVATDAWHPQVNGVVRTLTSLADSLRPLGAKVEFLKDDADLARIYAAADGFVFPGRSDTCGLAMLEALACGTPVAGFPVACIRDLIEGAPVALLDEDLRAACLGALALSRTDCRAFAETLTWEKSARCFLDNIQRAGSVTSATPILDALKAAAARTERKTAAPAIG
jgi:glycosyltransferase involved in cell wall biosynthesis